MVAVACAVLALGPSLHVLGETRFGSENWSVPLPYRWLQALPLVSVARVPARFALLTTLCLAVLAGLAIERGARNKTRGTC